MSSPPPLNGPLTELREALAGDARLVSLLDAGVALLWQVKMRNEETPTITTTTTTTTAVIVQPTEDIVVSFPDVSFASPRGSFVVDFSVNHTITLTGKSGVFHISKDEVKKLICLPGDGKQTGNMILIETSSQQSTTSSLPKILLAMPKLKSPHAPKVLRPDENNALVAVMAESKRRDECFEALCTSCLSISRPSRPDLVNTFKSFKGHACLPCHVHNVKEGFLWFLRDGLCFTQSPALYIDVQQMSSLQITAVTPKTFTLAVTIVDSTMCFNFSGIDISERAVVSEYVSRVKGWAAAAAAAASIPKKQVNGGKTHADDGTTCSSGSGEEDNNNNDDDDDDEDDSLYVSTDDDEDEEHESGGEANKNDSTSAVVGNADGSTTSSGSSNNDSSDDDDDSEDDDDGEIHGELAELVEEEPLKIDDDTLVLPDNKRLRRDFR